MLVNTKHVYVHNMGWRTISCFPQKEYNTNLKLQVQHNQGLRMGFRFSPRVRIGVSRVQDNVCQLHSVNLAFNL